MKSDKAFFYIGFNDSPKSEMDKNTPINEKIIKKHKSFYCKKRPFSHRTYSLKSFLKKKFCTTSINTKDFFQETVNSNNNILPLTENKSFDIKNIVTTSNIDSPTTIYKDKSEKVLKKNLSYTFLDRTGQSSTKNMRKINTYAGFKNIFKFSLKRSKKWIRKNNNIIKKNKLESDKSFSFTKKELSKLKRMTKSYNDIDSITPLSVNKWINIAKAYEMKKILKNHSRRTSNQSIDSGVTNSNTTISNSTIYKKQKSSGFDYISKALMDVSSNALTEHQNFFKWNFDKKIPEKEYVLAAIPCYEAEDTTRNGFLYITPKYLAYTSSHIQCYFLLTDIKKIYKHHNENHGKNSLEVFFLGNGTTYKFYGITDILNVYWLIYELKILKWDNYWMKKGGFTRKIKSSIKLKNYKNYFKMKHGIRMFKSLDKLNKTDDINDKISFSKTKDTLNVLVTNTGEKDKFTDEKTVRNNRKESQIIKAYNSFTRKKNKIPFLDLNSVKTNESDQLSLSDVSTSIDREDTSSATNSCTISTSSTSLNEQEKCFDIIEKNDECIEISYPVVCGCMEHVGRKHIDSTYNIPLNIFFQVLFSNVPWYEQLKNFIATSSKEMAFFEKMDKAVAEEWKLIDKNNKIYQRNVKFTMSFSQTMFSGKINVKEEQTLSPINNNYDYGGKLVKKVFNTGVPMADSFYIEVTYCLTRHSELQTHLQVYGNVVLRKQKGFFGSIKSTLPFDAITQSGLSDHYSSLNRVLYLFSADTTMYNSLLEILGRNNSSQGVPVTFNIPFTNSIESKSIYNSEINLNVPALNENKCSQIYNKKSVDLDLLNQINEIINRSIITKNINSINMSLNRMSNTVDSLNLKLDAMGKQLGLLIFIVILSMICQLFYFLHFYIFS